MHGPHVEIGLGDVIFSFVVNDTLSFQPSRSTESFIWRYMIMPSLVRSLVTSLKVSSIGCSCYERRNTRDLHMTRPVHSSSSIFPYLFHLPHMHLLLEVPEYASCLSLYMLRSFRSTVQPLLPIVHCAPQSSLFTLIGRNPNWLHCTVRSPGSTLVPLYYAVRSSLFLGATLSS
ncbi:hypothetical protein BDY19DRAFT_1003314 [Irpex rosettiformis]|uniref:Uncharacterized protein n=1 Tax=Irpex rosettiformis TaxID=378272 RepID=A0ACB8U6E2_9APHY|nr:hypothetical protein BDY19DRAFT_1003314 [Irpex rosettiformis]